MNVTEIGNEVQKVLRDNAPAILTGIGVSGALGTAYLTGRATWKAYERVQYEEELGTPCRGKDRFLLLWDLYIPPVATGIITVASILGANHVSSKRAAAAYTVAAVTEKAFSEYREKATQELGSRKEQKIRDEIAQERVIANPPGPLVIGTGTVLCCELFTGRYFMSDMETLRKAQNDVNARLIDTRYVSLEYFYDKVGLDPTSASNDMGWAESVSLMDLEFSTVISPDGRPCLAFTYNYVNPL